MKLTLDTDKQAFFYENEFYPLSNFSAFHVTVWGRDFDTAEHAYHWKKFCDTNAAIATRIRCARSAHEALKIAQNHKGERRRDWDEKKIQFMQEILCAKLAQHEYVKRKLLETGNRELVENSWRDDFWGWGENRDGQNWMGKLWMDLRSRFGICSLELSPSSTDEGR